MKEAIVTVLGVLIPTLGTVIVAFIQQRKATIGAVEESIKKTNADLTAKIGNVEKKVVDIETRLDSVDSNLSDHIKDDAEDNQKQRRLRIIQFAETLRMSHKHSLEQYEDVIEDIDNYEAYCDKHPEYHNNKGQVAMKHVLNCYEVARETGDFL